MQIYFQVKKDSYREIRNLTYIVMGAELRPVYSIGKDGTIMEEFNYTKGIRVKHIYKYFPNLNNWFIYGAFCSPSPYEISSSNLEKNIAAPTLSYYYKDNPVFRIGQNYSDSTITWATNQEFEQIKKKFDLNYNLYSNENKVKRYNKIKDVGVIELLDYLNFLGINKETVQKLNDMAYFFLEAKFPSNSIYLLENILSVYPERTVAYLNLADAYLLSDETTLAKEAYQKYISLMKKSGKGGNIPKRVFDRVK
ncbi:MAG TPA: hypothetical protein VF691_00580 [Cytophagaceae bacterium]